jgi:hypothetical protein
MEDSSAEEASILLINLAEKFAALEQHYETITH